jgi:hypothetical protein
VVKSSVMPSLKYSWSRSPVMLVKGRTAIEGWSGKARVGVWAGGMDADGVGGRSERCCTTTTVAALIATPAIEKIPRRVFSRGCWWQPDWAVPPPRFQDAEDGRKFDYCGRARYAGAPT